jgi:antitoxin CptB
VTGSRISSEGLDVRRRKLLFRSWHRGIREMDLVLGRFADLHIAGLSEPELDEYEHWLEIPDQEMFDYMKGAAAAPPTLDTPLFKRLRYFYRDGSALK